MLLRVIAVCERPDRFYLAGDLHVYHTEIENKKNITGKP